MDLCWGLAAAPQGVQVPAALSTLLNAELNVRGFAGVEPDVLSELVLVLSNDSLVSVRAKWARQVNATSDFADCMLQKTYATVLKLGIFPIPSAGYEGCNRTLQACTNWSSVSGPSPWFTLYDLGCASSCMGMIVTNHWT